MRMSVLLSWSRLLAPVAYALIVGCSSPIFANSLVEKLETSAEEGNGEASYHLGMMYLIGSEVEQDQNRALVYFRRAYELGDPLASYKLGCFYDGQYELVGNDYEKALEYKLIAAEAGYALAQQDVASLYARKGQYRDAVDWLERAAAQGTGGALRSYASIHNGATGIERDPIKTAAYFRLYLSRNGSSEQQEEWLRNFESTLTGSQIEEIQRVVVEYRAAPTSLTLKAISGLAAAQILVGGAN